MGCWGLKQGAVGIETGWGGVVGVETGWGGGD